MKTKNAHNEDKKLEERRNNLKKEFWIKNLREPNKRKAIKNKQVKEETLKLYSDICVFLDLELRKEKDDHKETNLIKEINRLNKQSGKYNNILYTIYCISEGHVTKVYSGEYNYQDLSFSYEILEINLGKKLRDRVLDKAISLEKDVVIATEETRELFNTTRENAKHNKNELSILHKTPPRNTMIWKIQNAKAEIIKLYLKLWEVIKNNLSKDIGWEANKKNIISHIIYDEKFNYTDQSNHNLLTSLLIVSENAVRGAIPRIKKVEAIKDMKIINAYLPTTVLKQLKGEIKGHGEKLKENRLTKIIEEITILYPETWQMKVELILSKSKDEQIDSLDKYKEDKNLEKIVKEIINRTDNEKPDEEPPYEPLKKNMALEASNRKTVKLNMNIIEKSKKELEKTIYEIDEYVGLEETDEVEDTAKEVELLEEVETEEVEISAENIDEKLKHMDFIKLIQAEGKISVDDASIIALKEGLLLNTFLSTINQELYKYTEDQTILRDDDYVFIDGFYIEMIEELILNEEES